MLLRLIHTVSLVTALSCGVAQARENFSKLTDGAVRDYLQQALKRLCAGQAAGCEPATEQELASPPVTIDVARSVLNEGVMSGFGEWCGLAWENRSFSPMIVHWRKEGLNKRQIQVINRLHSLAHGEIVNARLGRECPDKTRRSVEPKLDFQP